jgi:hypothetical protein
MLLIQFDHLDEALSPEGAHHAFGDGIRSRAITRVRIPRMPSLSIRASKSMPDPIPVMNQVARLLAVRRGIPELLPDPGHRGVFGDVDVD